MRITTFASAALLAASLLALTGCTDVRDALYKEARAEFTTTADVVASWGKSAPWLPTDATDIHTHEAADGAPAILAATSASALDPEQCVEAERQSGPVFDEEWSAEPFVDTVFACGDWAVIPTDGGWYGWTPNHPNEKAASETPASTSSRPQP